MTPEEEIHRLADELGVAPEEISNTYGEDEPQKTVDIDLTTQSIVRFEPVAPGSPEVGDYTETVAVGTQQLKKIIKKRPQCPTCGYILTEEHDPLHLPGKCYECEAWVCPECRSDCAACRRSMCPDHTGGHGLEAEPLCPAHAEQVEREQHHRRALDTRQDDRQTEQLRLDHARKQQTAAWEQTRQREQLELEKHQQRFENRYRGKQLEVKLLKMMLHAKNQAAESQRFKEKYQFDHLNQIEESVQDKR